MVFFFFINLINVGKRERERESIMPNLLNKYVKINECGAHHFKKGPHNKVAGVHKCMFFIH